MIRLKSHGSHFVLSLLTLHFLGGCASETASLDTPKHQEIIQSDQAKIKEQSRAEGIIKLSMEDAIDRALHYNLDARVSALEVLARSDDVTLEKLKALPNLSASTSAQGRNNVGAASSRSYLSGSQSLEPSYSSEQYRRTADLSLNWNLIDVAMAAMQTNSASDQQVIAKERHKKVRQNIERDVYSAYWRAYAAQETASEADILETHARDQLAKIDKAVSQKLLSKSQGAARRQALESQLSTLKTTRENIAYAEIELKSLLSYAPDTYLELTSEPEDYVSKSKSLLQKNTEALELSALMKRPEMRETIAQRNINIRDTRMEVLKTFPGIKLFFSGNYDSNDFLVDDKWTSFSATLMQSLTSLITAPARYEAAQKREAIEEARRLSLAAAIITQIHLSKARLKTLSDLYEIDRRSAENAQALSRAAIANKAEGFASGNDVTIARMEALNAKMNALYSHAQLEEAAATFLDSLGENTKEGLI